MKTAYLVYITQVIRVVAETEDKANEMAIIEAKKQSEHLNQSHIEDTLKNTECPYNPEFDDNNATAESPEQWAARSAKEIITTVDSLLSYRFAGYSVLDVIAMAGNDEHEINATEAKKILDTIRRDTYKLDIKSENLATGVIMNYISKFIDERNIPKINLFP